MTTTKVVSCGIVLVLWSVVAYAGAPPAVSSTCVGMYELDGSMPPADTSGSVGDTYMYQVSGIGYRVRKKDCSTSSETLLGDFFGTTDPSVMRPRLVHVPYASTPSELSSSDLAAAVSYDGQTGHSSVLLYVLQKADALYGHQYAFDMTAGEKADTVRVGYNKTWIVLSYRVSQISTGTQLRREIRVVSRADAYAGMLSSNLRQKVFTVAGTGTDIVPAITYDANEPSLYLLESVGGNVAGNGTVRLYAISGNVGSETFRTVSNVTAPAWASTGGAIDGTSFNLSVFGDDGFQQVFMRAGSLWAAHLIFMPATSPNHSEIQWWQISTAGTVYQHGTISHLDVSEDFAAPSLAVNANRDVMIGFSIYSHTGAGMPAGYVFRSGCDPANAMSDVAVYKTATVLCVAPYRSSATALDPNDLDFWTIQEWGQSPMAWSTVWGTIPRTSVGMIGDVNNDSVINAADVVALINGVLLGTNPGASCRGDVNADARVDMADVFYLINEVFAGGPPPL